VTRRAVGAPTDRLRRYYTARVELQLLGGVIRLYSNATGGLPRKKASLWEPTGDPSAWPEGGYLPGGRIPLDPWGEPYRIISDPEQVRIQVRDPSLRNLSPKGLTEDEAGALTSIARIRLSGEERRQVRDLLDRLSEDELEAREKASLELRGWGAAIHPELEERLRMEKDHETRLRIESIRRLTPERRPAWARELSPLEITITAQDSSPGDPALIQSCSNNLALLWKAQNVYTNQFGGRSKRMPGETGKDFWLALTKTNPPLLDPRGSDLFTCPASEVRGQPGACSYRGPARNVAEAADSDVIGMCDDEAHGEVAIILRKSGALAVIQKSDALYEEALEKTRP
jgi:hypothetical protein